MVFQCEAAGREDVREAALGFVSLTVILIASVLAGAILIESLGRLDMLRRDLSRIVRGVDEELQEEGPVIEGRDLLSTSP